MFVLRLTRIICAIQTVDTFRIVGVVSYASLDVQYYNQFTRFLMIIITNFLLL